jgi:hypothetical protein
MSVLDELQATVATQRAVLSALEPGCLSGPDALRLLEVFTAIERLGAAGRTLVAKRVEESNVWRQSGDRSAAHFIAKQTGTSVGRTQATLVTAERLAKLPRLAPGARPPGALRPVPHHLPRRAGAHVLVAPPAQDQGLGVGGRPGCYRLLPPGSDAGSRAPPRT